MKTRQGRENLPPLEPYLRFRHWMYDNRQRGAQMNDRDKRLCIMMTVVAIAVILFLLIYSMVPIPLLPLTAQ